MATVSVFVASIDAVQEMHSSAVSDRKIFAPCLEDYPPVTDTAKCPTILTQVENAIFGRLDENEATLDLVSRVLFTPIAQGRYGNTMLQIHEVMDDLYNHYTDDARYAQTGRRVIQKTPVEVAVIGGENPFTISGYQLLEYPENSGMAYHGFELRFTVQTATAGSDC